MGRRSASGWERLEYYLWCHLKGTCERNNYNHHTGVWRWTASPNGGEPSVIEGLKSAKKYVEDNGEVPKAKPMPGRTSMLLGWNDKV